MRIILDTNVLVSGLLFRGIPFRILEGIKLGKYSIVATKDIVDEYEQTIKRLSYKFPSINAMAQLRLIVLSSEICQPRKLIESICEDPDDDMFIACALAGNAKIIVSGDKLLGIVSSYQNIEVLSPRQFFER